MHQAQALMCPLQLARPCFPASCPAQAAMPLLCGHALRLQLPLHGTLPLLVNGSPPRMNVRLHTAQHQLKILFSCKPLGLHNECMWRQCRRLLHQVQALL